MANHSLFTKHSATEFTSILVYVDDLVIVIRNDLQEITVVKKTILDTSFKIKDHGNLKIFS